MRRGAEKDARSKPSPLKSGVSAEMLTVIGGSKFSRTE